MSFATRCPECGTAFRLSREQLDMADGWARCGQCNAVFRASDQLFDPTPPWVAGGTAPATSAAAVRPRTGFGDEPIQVSGTVAPAGLMPDIDLDLPGGSSTAAPAPTSTAPTTSVTPRRSPEDVPRPVPDFELDIPAIDPQSLRAGREAEADDPALWESLDRTRGAATSNGAGPGGEILSEPVQATAEAPAADAGATEPAPAFPAKGSGDGVAALADAAPDTAPEAGPTPESVNALYASVAQRDGWEDQAARAAAAKKKSGGALGTVLWSIGLLLTIIGLVLQWVRVDRDTLAAEWPALRPALQALCEASGCEVRPLRNFRSLIVDSSTLEVIPGTALHRWTLVLRHRGERPTLPPAVELTLQGEGGAIIARRVFTLEQLGQSVTVLEPKAELKIETLLELGGRPVSGHTTELFYP